MTAANSSETTKFDGSGVEYLAKYLGSCEVTDSQSHLLCQEAMQKVLASLKGRKEPKERLKVTLSLDGIRLMEATAVDGKGQLDLQFRHCEVSYVYRDPRDHRSCALVHTEADPEDAERKISKLYAIRTVKSATPLLNDLRELFQLVKEMRERSADQEGVPREIRTGKEAAAAATAAAAPAKDQTPPPETSQQLDEAPAVAQAAVDLLDMSQPETPVRKVITSSSADSLDELNELFSSQASLASSGGQPAAASFNPWAPQQPIASAVQSQLALPPTASQYTLLSRQLSHPVPAYAREPIRKGSHPNMLEPDHGTAMTAYLNTKRPSDPGYMPYFRQHELYQYCQQQQQQQQQAAFYGQYPPVQYPEYYQQQQQQQPYSPYGPVHQMAYAYPQQQIASPPLHCQPMPPVWLAPSQRGPQAPSQAANRSTADSTPPPTMPPTSATQLVDGGFVSVFDRAQCEQQAETKTT